MNSKPTPCIAVYVNFNFVSQFVSLFKADTTSRHKVLVSKHHTGMDTYKLIRAHAGILHANF